MEKGTISTEGKDLKVYPVGLTQLQVDRLIECIDYFNENTKLEHQVKERYISLKRSLLLKFRKALYDIKPHKQDPKDTFGAK